LPRCRTTRSSSWTQRRRLARPRHAERVWSTPAANPSHHSAARTHSPRAGGGQTPHARGRGVYEESAGHLPCARASAAHEGTTRSRRPTRHRAPGVPGARARSCARSYAALSDATRSWAARCLCHCPPSRRRASACGRRSHSLRRCSTCGTTRRQLPRRRLPRRPRRPNDPRRPSRAQCRRRRLPFASLARHITPRWEPTRSSSAQRWRWST
jgi:hypothetical protein